MREDHGADAIAHIKLRENASDVRFHRGLGQKESLCDLVVGESLTDQLEDGALTFRQKRNLIGCC